MGQDQSKQGVTHQLAPKYDYIIVGGGTAGCVLAARLTEDPTVTVAVLEVGVEDTVYQAAEVPAFSPDLCWSTAAHRYVTVPQTRACKSLRGKVAPCIAGEVLGGSSTINHLLYARGSRYDYDAWESAGCKGWGYGDVLPYFIKAENNKNEEFAKSGYHGTTGPLVVTDSIPSPRITTALLDAAREMGYYVGDLNAGSTIGFSHCQLCTSRGRRVSAATAYLRPAMDRPNLHVATRAFAKRIIFNGRRAQGVQYFRHNQNCEVRVRREVIVCAGGIESPKLLLLSGVGPKDHLEKLKIPLVADLAGVGDNLQCPVWTDAAAATMDHVDDPTSSLLRSYVEYTLFGRGHLANSGSVAYGFLRSDHQPNSDLRPHLFFCLSPTLLTDHTVSDTLNIVSKVHSAIYGKVSGRKGVTLMVALAQPRSRGSVRLSSSDPFDPPIIDPAFLSDKSDVKTLVDGIRKARALLETGAFQCYTSQLITSHHPACASVPYDSDAYWASYARHNTFSLGTYSGTCKMGATDDQSAVVDPEMRVRGFSGLRVVDASIQPDMTSGVSYASVVMIAEKAADIIKSYYE